MARDARIAVTIEEPATPWPIVVYFIRVFDDKVGATALVNVGFELGQRFDVTPGEPPQELERFPRPLDRRTVDGVLARFSQYVQYARAQVEFQEAQETPGAKPSGRRRELTDDFLSEIAGQYRAWSAGQGRAVTEIANAHGVNRSTASRWVAAARARGYIEEERRNG
jgi:hypothetical protein